MIDIYIVGYFKDGVLKVYAESLSKKASKKAAKQLQSHGLLAIRYKFTTTFCALQSASLSRQRTCRRKGLA